MNCVHMCIFVFLGGRDVTDSPPVSNTEPTVTTATGQQETSVSERFCLVHFPVEPNYMSYERLG